VADDYFRTLGLPLLRGREFSKIEVESTDGSPVAIIDEPLAKQLWPDQDPVGCFIQFGDDREGREAMQVIGLVPGIRDLLLDREPRAHIYSPFGQRYRSAVTFHLKVGALSHRAEGTLLTAVRQTIRAVDQGIPILSVQTFQGFHGNSLLVWMFGMGARLSAVFGGLALLLAVVGLYGVRAYGVARDTRQLGIRIALGATQKNVLWMVLKEGVLLVCLGLGLGLPLAWGAGHVLGSMLFGIGSPDPATCVTAALCLAATTLVACTIPARRAARIDPMEALRCE